jgi:hypothetical protein
VLAIQQFFDFDLFFKMEAAVSKKIKYFPNTSLNYTMCDNRMELKEKYLQIMLMLWMQLPSLVSDVAYIHDFLGGLIVSRDAIGQSCFIKSVDGINEN